MGELKHSRWFVFVLTPPEDSLRFHRQHQMASDPFELIFLVRTLREIMKHVLTSLVAAIKWNTI